MYIGIVSQAGNWKYFDFEEPESVKIKHIHTAKNKVYVLIAWSLCPDMSGHQANLVSHYYSSLLCVIRTT